MNKYLSSFFYNIRTGKMFNIVILTLFLIGCTSTETINTPTLNPTTTLLPFLETASPTVTFTPEFVLRPSPTQTSTRQPTSTITPTLTPTPIILPELLIAAVEVKNKGEENESSDVWVIDTFTQEKKLVFTATLGTQEIELMWAETQTNILYISEIKGGDANEPINWQFYEVNYKTGESHPFFSERVGGYPDLIDLSFGGKWLCVLVNYFETFEWWFINVENGEVIKNLPQERYLDGFVWSPNEPNTFAYYEKPAYDGNQIMPQKIVISQLPDFETLGTLEYDGIWMESPLLLWGASNPEQLLFFSLGQMYQIDLNSEQWVQIAQGLGIFPGDLHTQIFQSFSGQWAITTRYIQLISLNIPTQVFDAFSQSDYYHQFLFWYNEEDWGMIVTDDGIQVYDFGNGFALLREIRLVEYGLTTLASYATIAKPRN